MSSSLIRSTGLAFLVLATVACQSDEEKFAAHLSRGDAYFEEEKFREAIIEYKNVLQVDPNAGEVHFKLSKAYMKDGKVREGFWELRETVRLDESNVAAKVQLAQMLFLGKELEEALVQIEEAIAAEPDRPEAHVVKANILDGMNRSPEALLSYAKAVEVAPDAEGPILLYASALAREGDEENAEKWYVRLIEVAPSFRSYNTYGGFLARTRDESRIPEVEELMKKGVAAAKPEEIPRAYGALAGFYYSRERIDEAIATLGEGIEKADDKLDLIYTLARFHAMQGNEEKADALIEQATAASPDEARPYLILSAYRDRKGDYVGALAAARKAVEVEPDNESARLREAEVVIEIGVREKNQEKIDEGRALVDELLAQQPDHPAGLLVRSKIDLYEKNADAAVAALRTAISARPDWAQAHFVLGTALAVSGDQTGARSELARALEIDASLLQARRVLAQVHAGLRENEYAVEEARRYLRERPKDVQMRILLAQSLIRLGKVEEAERELGAIPEEDRNAEVHYAYGRIRMGRRDFEASREHLLAALEDLPSSIDIINSLYLIDRAEGRVDETVARIEAALENEPENAGLYTLRGKVAVAEGRGESAEADFKKAIDLEPDILSAYESLARFYASTGRLAEAIETYESAVAVRPKAAQLYHLLGVLYELAGDKQKAIKNYELAIRYQPNLGEAKNNLAYLFADAGENLDRALDLAQEAKALMPDSANAADTLGWVLYKRGVPGAAISYLKEAEVGSGPDDPGINVIRYHLALAYENNGDKEAALAALERALTSLDSQLEAAREAGGTPPEPSWAAEARSLLDRLRAS
ncbi:MAG: tetratricopeptide repeat protein [Deltaproteobacteria bacterium]|nr:tetratricopeptide repeat protein [Deltaproteobacteria bacterium]